MASRKGGHLECRAGKMAPRAGIEPATFRLTVERSTAELPRNKPVLTHRAYNKAAIALQSMNAGRKPGLGADAAGKSRPPALRPGEWRPRPESNRRARICSPLRNHSATWPSEDAAPACAGRALPQKAKRI
jgi:hypothetical protein